VNEYFNENGLFDARFPGDVLETFPSWSTAMTTSKMLVAASCAALLLGGASTASAQRGGGGHGGGGGGFHGGGMGMNRGGNGGATSMLGHGGGFRGMHPSPTIGTHGFGGWHNRPFVGGWHSGPFVPRGFVRGGAFVQHGAFMHGHPFVGPVRFFHPYYAFHPHVAVGLGLWAGYPFAYPYAFYNPYYYPYYPYYSYNLYPPYGSTSPSYGSVSSSVEQTNMGGLSFEITPNTAEVYVDNVRVGTVGEFTATTQPLGLSAGHHHIEIRANGYRTMTLDVDIIAGQVIPYQGSLER